jgi:hypothetical protein
MLSRQTALIVDMSTISASVIENPERHLGIAVRPGRLVSALPVRATQARIGFAVCQQFHGFALAERGCRIKGCRSQTGI